MNEQWRPVKNYEDSYEVSSTGLVRTKERIRPFGRATKTFYSQIVSPSEDKDGYFKVNLSEGGKKKRVLVHRLVAEAFIPNPNNKPTVNHIDGNKQNNDLSNLEWATHSENRKHAFETGLQQPHNGGTNKSILMIDKITNQIIKEYESLTEASEDSGYSIPRISYSANKEASSKGNIIWRFK